MKIEGLLPHRAPMLFVEALTEWSEKEARATACFGNDDYAVADENVLETALVECIAQTVAAAQGTRARQSGKPAAANMGMLAAVSAFRILHRPAAGQKLEIHVRELKRLGPMLLVVGTITCDGQMVATGELSFYA